MNASHPETLFCDESTSKLVDQRRTEYFPMRNVEMGDSARGHLA